MFLLRFQTHFYAALLIAFGCAVTCSAQQTVIQLSATNNGEEQYEEILENLKGGMEFRLQSLIRDIENVCELSEDQAQKLRVASKGAVGMEVEKQEEALLKNLRRYQQQAGFDIEKLEKEKEELENGTSKDGEEPDANEEEEDDDDDEPVIRNFAFVLNTPPTQSIDSSSLWKSSLKKVLTEEQSATYESANAERDEFYKKSAVDRFVAGVEMKLFLTPEQRVSITEVIAKEFGDKLVDELRFEALNRNRGINVRNGAQPQHEDLVREILTEEQLGEWNRSIEPLLLNLSRIRRQ